MVRLLSRLKALRCEDVRPSPTVAFLLMFTAFYFIIAGTAYDVVNAPPSMGVRHLLPPPTLPPACLHASSVCLRMCVFCLAGQHHDPVTGARSPSPFLIPAHVVVSLPRPGEAGNV